MSRTSKSLFDALGESAATASLLARIQTSERLARILAGAAVAIPGFDPLAPGTCEVRGRTLHLRAPSSAVAAKLRQCLPSLLAALHRQGSEVSEIKVRVQPGQPAYLNGVTQETAMATPEQKAARLKNVSEARRFADTLAAQLDDGNLREALQKLSRSLKRIG